MHATYAEIAYVLVALVGLLANLWCLGSAWRAFGRVKKHPAVNMLDQDDLRSMAQSVLETELTLCFLQLFLLFLGSIALTVPTPPPRTGLHFIRTVARWWFFLASIALAINSLRRAGMRRVIANRLEARQRLARKFHRHTSEISSLEEDL